MGPARRQNTNRNSMFIVWEEDRRTRQHAIQESAILESLELFPHILWKEPGASVFDLLPHARSVLKKCSGLLLLRRTVSVEEGAATQESSASAATVRSRGRVRVGRFLRLGSASLDGRFAKQGRRAAARWLGSFSSQTWFCPYSGRKGPSHIFTRLPL